MPACLPAETLLAWHGFLGHGLLGLVQAGTLLWNCSHLSPCAVVPPCPCPCPAGPAGAVCGSEQARGAAPHAGRPASSSGPVCPGSTAAAQPAGGYAGAVAAPAAPRGGACCCWASPAGRVGGRQGLLLGRPGPGCKLHQAGGGAPGAGWRRPSGGGEQRRKGGCHLCLCLPPLPLPPRTCFDHCPVAGSGCSALLLHCH